MSEAPNIPAEQTARLRRAKWPVILLLAVLVIAGGWKGFGYAKPHMSLIYARREFSKQQFMRAEFWASRAVSVDDKNVEAARLLAEINEVQDRPAALRWRIRVVQLEPGNSTDIMAWAKCAMRFNMGEMTLTALNSLPEDFKKWSAEYHELMAGCAMANHEPAVAEAYFARAAELDHANPVYRVGIAAFRLTNSTNSEVRAAAANDLEEVMPDPRVSLYAARSLLGDAIRSGDHARAQRFAEEIRSLPEHSFSDDLSCLQAVMSGPGFQPALAEIEHGAEADAQKVTEACDWLNSHGMAAETLRWFAQLPGGAQSNMRVQIAVAEAWMAMRDWNGLQSFLGKCHWEGCEFLRNAMLIRCKQELSQPWEKEWSQLAAVVDANPPDGLLLAQLVIGWQWRKESIDLLWEAETKPATKSRALQSLWGLYSATNETAELWRVAKAQTEFEPENPTRKNNEAFLSLLLHGASVRSEHLAREAVAANPNVPEWEATYAYALHLAGKDADAKKVMENLPPRALGRPGIALYYAIVLAANGDYTHARETLAKLNPAGMLPEEKKLAANLMQQLEAAGR